MLAVQGTLLRRDGSVLWQNASLVNNLRGETPSNAHEEYIEKPELIRQP